MIIYMLWEKMVGCPVFNLSYEKEVPCAYVVVNGSLRVLIYRANLFQETKSLQSKALTKSFKQTGPLRLKNIQAE